MATEPPQHLHPWEKGPLERTDDEHVEAADYQFHGLGSVVQMTRRLRDAMVRQQKATNWLAIGIFVLTVALVLIALGVIGPIYTTSAWVLWSEAANDSRGNVSQGPWENEEAFERLKDCQRMQAQLWKETVARYEKNPDLEQMEKTPYKSVIARFKESKPTTGGKFTFTSPAQTITKNFICFPDTLDPREKK